jgi:hypothetical protein
VLSCAKLAAQSATSTAPTTAKSVQKHACIALKSAASWKQHLQWHKPKKLLLNTDRAGQWSALQYFEKGKSQK